MKYFLGAVVAAAITIFAVQNTAPIAVRFLVWSLPETPVAAVILVSVMAGVVLVGLPLSIGRWRLRARARSLEARLAIAEARGAERDSSPGPPAPPGAAGRPPTF